MRLRRDVTKMRRDKHETKIRKKVKMTQRRGDKGKMRQT